MNFLDIIEKQRTKKPLTKEEVEFAINQYVNDKIPDYQFAAFIMAININNIGLEQTYWLTNSMLHSGNTVDFSSIKGIKIDKHSTGGVGDKVSVIIGPILAACGLKVAKMSGPGLGHTGGTIDKLNSIGVNTNLTLQQCKKLLKDNGIFIASQTDDIVPADKKIYALRNATSTVDSLPLIASSIASKKVAMGTDYIFIDVKVGDGGFCETYDKAFKLGKILISILKKFNRKSIVHITNMNQPLGRSIGNCTEMKTTIEFLNGKPESKDVKELIYEFSSDILIATKICKNKKEAYENIDEVINSKKALEVFKKWISSQHANANEVCKNKFFKPKYSLEIKADKSGYVKYKSAREVGMISFLLGAGREVKGAPIDFQAGVFLNKIINEKVNKGETIATLYSSKKINSLLIEKFKKNILYSNSKFKELPVIVKVIK